MCIERIALVVLIFSIDIIALVALILHPIFKPEIFHWFGESLSEKSFINRCVLLRSFVSFALWVNLCFYY